MPFLSGGGSTPAAPTTSQQPQSGLAQVYQPQQQPQADVAYNNLLYQGLLAPFQAGTTPAQQLWQPAANTALDYYQNAALSPFYDQLINQTAANPYYSGAQGGANFASALGFNASSLLNDIFNATLANIPQAQSNLAGIVTGEMTPLQNLANDVTQLYPQAATLPGQTLALAPQFANLTGNVLGNVPATQALAGQSAAYAPQIAGLAGQIAGGAPVFGGLSGAVSGTLPQYQAAAQRTLGTLPQAQAQTSFLTGLEGLPTGAPSLQSGAGRILQTGFDPQNALFNQLTQQTRDQANALNAMSGLANTPYGTGLTSQALQNLDINWQNQQLGRQATALGAAGGALGQAQGLNLGQAALGQDVLSSLGQQAGLNQAALANLTGFGGQAGTAANIFGGGQNALLNAISGLGAGAGVLGQAGGLYGQAANIGNIGGGLLGQQAGLNTQALNQLLGTGQLAGQAGGLYGQAAGLAGLGANIYGQAPGSALTTAQLAGGLPSLEAGSAALPQQAYLQNLQSQLAAQNAKLQALSGVIPQLTGAANLGQAQYQLPQDILNNLTNYLQLGRGASLAGGALGQIGSQEAAQGLSGAATLGVLSSPLLFGSAGVTDALGLPSTGLVGGLQNLFGAGGAAGAADFSGGTAGALSDASLAAFSDPAFAGLGLPFGF